MLQKWKSVLTNWINCYFNDEDKTTLSVTLETLVEIISHLRENFNLDESKSSLLEAHTINDFISEKYPYFKFENGTTTPMCEQEVYIAASLLLYFVCVNSKNVHIKSAMCKKLSGEDQEVILKFSKFLMACAQISCDDVLAAIRDSCMQEISGSSEQFTVSETPPALRSLHSEVRRLQAALDAERFDRNFLQEELSRTNFKLQKLLNDKEQCKLEILNLKAKISLCCGDNKESKISEPSENNSAKLKKQLEEAEERLASVQEQMDDLQHERDVFKTKLDEIKQQYDTLLNLNQQEIIRATQLAEELEIERRQTQSLQELVSELQQHNRLNGLDTSQLECDDIYVSMNSPQNNTSVCSEACANVIEVQLSEERAKIVDLQQQIQNLEGQLNDLTKRYEDEKQSFTNIVIKKDNEILSLKNRIDEELETKITMKLHFDNEVNKLSSDFSEMEQKLKETTQSSKQIIESKMDEIQTLQEEKISLLHSLNNETAKLENVIKNLQSDIAVEKAAKIKLSEEFDKKVMLLNDKVLNKNNELFELQDKIIKNGEEIENLQRQLKKEKELKDDLSNKHNNDIMNLSLQKTELEKELHQKSKQLVELEIQLKQYADMSTELKKKVDYLNNCCTQSQEECKLLNENKERLLNDIKNRDIKLDKSEKEMENLEKGFHEMSEKLTCSLNESQATIHTLKSQLQDEIEYKLRLQKTISDMEKVLFEKDDTIAQTCKEKEDVILALNEKINKLSGDVEKKDMDIKEFNDNLLAKTKMVDDLQKDFNSETTKLATKLSDMEKILKDSKAKSSTTIENLELTVQKLNLEIEKLIDLNKDIQQKLVVAENEKSLLVQKLSEEIVQRNNIEKEYLQKCSAFNNTTLQYNEEILKYRDQITHLKENLQTIENEHIKKCTDNKTLEWNISQTLQNHKNILVKKDTDLQELLSEVNEVKALNVDLQNQLKTHLAKHDQSIEALKREHEQLRKTLEQENSRLRVAMEEKNCIIKKLESDMESLLHQLEKVKLDYDVDKGKWEKSKCNMDDMIKKKDIQINEYNLKVNLLNEKNAVLTKQNNNNVEIIQNTNKEIEQLRKTCAHHALGNSELEGSLAMEKAVRDSLESEKQNLQEQNRILLQKTFEDQVSYKVLEAERDALLNEKTIMIQELLEEKSVRKIIEEEKETVMLEKNHIEVELNSLNCFKNTLLQEKECLTQQLVEEGLNKKILEDEKFKIADIKAELDEKLATEILNRMHVEKQLNSSAIVNENLSEEISKLKTMINALENEKLKLYQQVESFILQKEDSLVQINQLNRDVQELTDLKNKINSEKSEVCQEKDSLIKITNDLRLELEQITAEKKNLNQKCEELMQKYSIDLNNSEEQIQNITSEYNVLKSDYKNLQGENEIITSIMANVFDNIIAKIKYTNHAHLLENVLISNLETAEKFRSITEIVSCIIEDLSSSKNMEKYMEQKIAELKNTEKENQLLISKLQDDLQNLHTIVEEYKNKLIQEDQALESKASDIRKLQTQNDTLHNELTTIKVQLDEKVHSLKDKLIDNENLTDKLKETYECQIDNLNMMVTKLTTYLKDKTTELDSVGLERDKLQASLEQNIKDIKSFEDEIKSHKQIHEKLISEFDSERQVLKNMVTVTESVMDDQKASLNKVISGYIKTIDTLQEEITALKDLVDAEKNNSLTKLKEKENAFEALFQDLNVLRREKESLENRLQSEMATSHNTVTQLTVDKGTLLSSLDKCKKDIACKDEAYQELKIKLDQIVKERDTLNEEINEFKINNCLLQEKLQSDTELINKVPALEKENTTLLMEKIELIKQINALNVKVEENIVNSKNITKLEKIKVDLEETVNKQASELSNMKSQLECVVNENKKQQNAFDSEKLNLTNKCSLLQEYQEKATKELDERQKEIDVLEKNIDMLICERDEAISSLRNSDSEIEELNKIIIEERKAKEHYINEMAKLKLDVSDLRQRLDEAKQDLEVINVLRKENEELYQLVGERETFSASSHDKSSQRYQNKVEMELRQLQNQVDNTSTDTHTSTDSFKTISDLEMILQDKNRAITSLQSDITFLKTLVGESENKLLDVTKDLELSKENCQQLSSQLKKIVHQKNEEIAELKKQVTKMSATENRATQIIKLSARYQAMILKRVAELKTNTILKELTNFGNSTNCDNDIRRNLNAGSVTMEDLENFLDTTDRHLKRCAERQIALQKERDRLSEVNRITESEVINMRKFLTELSVSVKTFNSVKELYGQKLSRVVSLQRTVRREILNLDGQINDPTMCKLERGYAAVMQDLSECAMNMERWVERCMGRTISSEKIKQAFASELDRVSLASSSFQNTSLEVQLEELESSFQKLLEEVNRARNGEGVKDAQSVTVLEVRAEYEDKLNRMKAKMKQLYQEQISLFKERQKDEIANLERELEETRNKLEESSRAYEKHIRSLTTELWNVGEKFLMKKDEAEWLRKTQRSGSLMSLQHVHSSGLVVPPEEPCRPSDSHSLRSLPVTNNTKETRGVHMSDEEGEVFDNRWLKELSSTPRRERESIPPGQRLSELRWRNSLCPPHLKSSYPAETQFAPALHEEDIKMSSMSLGGRAVRKEVGITAYKKPGPPTPSKQAGRLSATDSELRESLRVETEPSASRKTSTPSRLRSLFRSNKNETAEVSTNALSVNESKEKLHGGEAKGVLISKY
ncbi:unnamed protein product [Leptosia nina]|uniref:Uncharacterized protein n=1 Tax=Leptosia nina TaxID=320188 RepID=A0AAV1JUB0_9NEOP